MNWHITQRRSDLRHTATNKPPSQFVARCAGTLSEPRNRNGRYWARTSDPQIVDPTAASAAGSRLSPIRLAEPLSQALGASASASSGHVAFPESFHRARDHLPSLTGKHACPGVEGRGSIQRTAAYNPGVESNGLSVRTYRPGDEHAIQAVYETVFGRKRSLAEWRWRFQGAPAGPGMLHVLENEDGIVGHIAHIPFPTWVDGQRLVVGQGGDTMTLPACRGKGGMRRLVEASLSEHIYDLRLNFPSAMARPLFVRYGAGTVVAALPSWVRRHSLTHPLPGLVTPLARTALTAGSFAADRPRPRVAVEALDELGAEVDELAAASASFARCIRIRDSAYLRWRWLAQPDARWEIRAARAEDGRLTGISVLGLEAGAHGRTGWINDLLAPDLPTLRALLLDGVAQTRRAGSRLCPLPLPRPATLGPARLSYAPASCPAARTTRSSCAHCRRPPATRRSGPGPGTSHAPTRSPGRT